MKKGAIQLEPRFIEWYCLTIRQRVKPRILRQVVDRIVAYTFGVMFLQRNQIQVVATEWTGHFGRVRSEFFLRPARFLRIPTFSLPHGYFLWRNSIFNKALEARLKQTGGFPDFSDRNWFNRYIVQSPEHRAENVKYGMNPDNITVLGSARFCEAWSKINDQLLKAEIKGQEIEACVILFFLPHWDYQVHREQCVSLLAEIARQEGIFLYVKAHTRGTGALTEEEMEQLQIHGNVEFPAKSQHSAQLMKRSNIVVNFGSSVAFEALRQKKPVINPRYLHGNDTFFDDSGVVFDTTSEVETLQILQGLKLAKIENKSSETIERFLQKRVEGGGDGRDVLQSYLDVMVDG